MRVKDAVGRFGEDAAVRHLRSVGLTVIERNWRCPDGELDVVAHDGRTLVVVEVKTRSSLAFGSPAAAVDRRKAARIRRLALLWIEAHRAEHPHWDCVRFDVIAVLRRDRGDGPDVSHLLGAF